MSKLQPVRGTRDLFGDDARSFAHVVKTFEDVAERFTFQPIATPIFEFTNVFARTMGDSSDVVSKEMYVFEDRGGESLALRPENTAGIARAYLSGGLQQFAPIKVYAHGPMFRYERPQKGRYRQFHQIDAEIIGAPEPQADVELIAMAYLLLNELGLGDKVELNINTLADPESRAAYRVALTSYFQGHADKLSKDSQIRLEKNPLRILDSKDEGDRALCVDAPIIDDHMNTASQDFFKDVLAGLDALGIPYIRNRQLVRGLDYYSHSVFEFLSGDLGAQNAVLSGGRYDGLIEQLGGPSTPGTGWAAGIERLAMLATLPAAAAQIVSVIPMGEDTMPACQKLAQELRVHGMKADIGYRGNFKKRMKRANAIGAAHAFIMGSNELSAGEVAVKDLAAGDQQTIKLDQVAAWAQAQRGLE